MPASLQRTSDSLEIYILNHFSLQRAKNCNTTERSLPRIAGSSYASTAGRHGVRNTEAKFITQTNHNATPQSIHKLPWSFRLSLKARECSFSRRSKDRSRCSSVFACFKRVDSCSNSIF